MVEGQGGHRDLAGRRNTWPLSSPHLQSAASAPCWPHPNVPLDCMVRVESGAEEGDGRILQMTYGEHARSSHTGRDNKGKLPIAGEEEFPG